MCIDISTVVLVTKCACGGPIEASKMHSSAAKFKVANQPTNQLTNQPTGLDRWRGMPGGFSQHHFHHLCGAIERRHGGNVPGGGACV